VGGGWHGDRDATTYLRDGSNRTGGPGGGRELAEHGYQVVATDIATTRDDLEAGALRADLTDYGQALEALKGAEGVIHLANIPAPGLSTPAVTFNANVTMNFNVFHAAASLGLRRGRVGVERDDARPPFRPAVPGSGGIAAAICPGRRGSLPRADEHIRALEGCERDDCGARGTWSGIPFVALRFSNIMVEDDYEEFPSMWSDAHARKWNLWGYVDVRDVAAACRWPSRRRQRRLQAARASSSPQRTPS
jgi:Nucleoside-diphosphate-sugar epimerases